MAARGSYLNDARASTRGAGGEYASLPQEEQDGLYRQGSLDKRQAGEAARKNQDLFRRVWNATVHDMRMDDLLSYKEATQHNRPMAPCTPPHSSWRL